MDALGGKRDPEEPLEVDKIDLARHARENLLPAQRNMMEGWAKLIVANRDSFAKTVIGRDAEPIFGVVRPCCAF